MIECADCCATLKRVRDGVRGPMRCDDCRNLHDKQRNKQHDTVRMKVRCEEDKAKRRALRNPNCRDCDQPLAFDDSGERMDMKIYCSPCLNKRPAAVFGITFQRWPTEKCCPARAATNAAPLNRPH